MKKSIIVFLLIVTPILAALLAFLGWATLKSNLMGWFLITVGVVYCIGLIFSTIVHRKKFWESASNEEVRKEEKSDRSFWFITIGMGTVFFLSPVDYLFIQVTKTPSPWFPVLGLAVVIAGTLLFIWARRTLRHAYSGHLEVKDKQPLIQAGPYRIIRHPAYAGYLLMALGLVIGYTSLLGFFAFVFLLIPATVFRINVEESLLSEGFGDEYQIYITKTSRILPHIW